jgi:hypothetical protein
MPAKLKTTAETQTALRRLFEARAQWERNERDVWPPLGMERTPGFTVQESPWGTWRHENREPQVWVLRRQVRQRGTIQMQDTDPLVTALWDTLPEAERRRSRLFACCANCPVRFTKKGAIADTYRCGRVTYDAAANQEERQAARLASEAPPPELDPQNHFERMVVEVWPRLTTLQRRTLYAEMRPSGGARRWAVQGASSPQAYASRVRSAYRGLARELGRRFRPGKYDLPGAGRTGFDYERFFDEWNLI